MIDRDEQAQQSFDLSVRLRDEQDLRRRMEESLQRSREEKEFLENWLPMAQSNLERLTGFLQAVIDAEAARQAAAAQKTRR